MKIAGVLLCLCCLTTYAHEIGTTRVTANFARNRTFNIEVVTDAASLADKLGTTVEAGRDRFRQRVKIAFDGVPVEPSIDASVTPAASATSVPVATIRLTGHVPDGAHRFTWTYGWTFASYAFSVRTAGSESARTEWLEGNQASNPVELGSLDPPVTRMITAWRYLVLGFTHILPNGLDHMLFVLGIYLLSGRARSVLLQVSAFTIAHSITLGLSMYGLISVSPRLVEPMIALSIAYVAIENVFLSELKAWRVVLVFAFGLLHGMGFAGALQELGLPRSEFLTALLTFNLGVEAGQLAVIGTAFLLVGWHYSQRTWYRSRIVVPASMAIAVTAVYWTVGRIL